jgi:hypothetical protein
MGNGYLLVIATFLFEEELLGLVFEAALSPYHWHADIVFGVGGGKGIGWVSDFPVAAVEGNGVVFVWQESWCLNLRLKRLRPMNHLSPITQGRLIRHSFHNLHILPWAMRIKIKPAVVLCVVGPLVEITDSLGLSKRNVCVKTRILHALQKP